MQRKRVIPADKLRPSDARHAWALTPCTGRAQARSQRRNTPDYWEAPMSAEDEVRAAAERFYTALNGVLSGDARPMVANVPARCTRIIEMNGSAVSRTWGAAYSTVPSAVFIRPVRYPFR